jgi:hypothetical protein
LFTKFVLAFVLYNAEIRLLIFGFSLCVYALPRFSRHSLASDRGPDLRDARYRRLQSLVFRNQIQHSARRFFVRVGRAPDFQRMRTINSSPPLSEL